MPFSSLTDPGELARAQAALEAAWNAVKSSVPEACEEKERNRLSYIVAALVSVARDDEDLKQRTIERYRRSTVI